MEEVKEVPKTLEELKEERDELQANLEDYLSNFFGAHMVKDVIRDLKDQMYLSPYEDVNNMIADLINLENQIIYEEEKQKAEGKQMQ